jgi:limonene-1,2-epoxide hydrolase
VQREGRYGNPSARQAEIAVVRAIYAAFARRDVEAALEHLADDVEFVPAGTASLVGRSAPYIGPTNAIWVWRVRDEKASSMRATSLAGAPPSS